MKRRRHKQILSPPKFPGDDDGLKDDLKQFIYEAPELIHGMMREEERFGKWIGLLLAIVFWIIVMAAYVGSHQAVTPMKPYEAPTHEVK